MKKLSLLVTGIKSFKRNNPIIFFVYITGYVLMCFVFIYVYTNYMPSVVSGADNKIDSRYYIFGVQNENCDFEQLYEYLGTYEPLYCDLVTYITIEELLGEGEEYHDEFPEDGEKDHEEIKVEVMTRMDSNFKDFFSGEVMNQYDVINALINNENIIVIPESLGYNDEIIAIDGDEFIVVLSGERSYVVMSYMSYKKHFCPDNITIVVGKALRNGKHEEFLYQLENEFGLSVIHEPSEFMGTDYEINMYYSKKIIVIFGVAVCIFMLLIRFLLEYSKYEYTIYRLVGARYDTVTSIVFSQTILTNGFLILVSICIYELFYDCFFEKMNMYRDIHMKISDYAFMTGVLMLFSSIAIVPFIIYTIRNSISKCINYYS